MKFFAYSSTPLNRKHGPYGYTRYQAYKPWLRDEFVFECAYCLFRELWYPNGHGAFSSDHFVSRSQDSSKTLDYDNIVYACLRCNSLKQDHDVLDPFKLALSKHMRINSDGSITPLTPEGSEHVQILGLDDPILTKFRAKVIFLAEKLQALEPRVADIALRDWFGFPVNLPNLKRMRPRGNTRPDGVKTCFYEQRKAGTLPKIY